MGPEDIPDFQRVGIVGLGVMGGSLARALGGLSPRPFRVGWSPKPGEPRTAVAAGALDHEAGTLQEVVAGSDLLVLAAPVRATCALVAEVAPHLASDAVLMDVAGLKVPVARAVTAAGETGRWVGSHPMCGSAESGFEASRADLFMGAKVYLVADPSAAVALGRVTALWRALGAEPVQVEAPEHDARMAWVSHLPQLTANALATVLMEAGIDPADLGPGGRDMTRLAASSPAIWRDVLASSERLEDHLREVARELERMADSLSTGDLDAIGQRMARTRTWQRRS